MNIAGSRTRERIENARTILIVEDDESFSRLIEENLQRAGFQTERAAKGTEAINYVASNRETLMLLDYRLPDMTAHQVIEALAKKEFEVPFIIITGHGDEKLAVDVMKLGARDYLVKETGLMDLLLPTVNSVVGQLTSERALRETQGELREKEEQYRDLVEKAQIGILMADKDGNFTYFNRRFLELFGYSSEETKKQSIHTLVHPEDVKRVMGLHNRIFQGEQVLSRHELRGVKKDGTFFWLEVDVVALEEDGVIVGTRSYLRDTTERKLAEDKIREVQERFSGLYASSKDAIGWADLDGGLLDVNDAFCNLTGYSKEELLGGMRYQEITPKEFREWEAKTVRAVIKTGEPVEYEKEYIRKDGSRVPILLTVFVVKGASNKPICVAAIIKDITERKQAEKALLEEKALFQTLVDNLPDSIYFKDEHHRFVRVNREKASHHDTTPDQMIGKTDFDFFPEERVNMSFADDNHVLQTGNAIIDKEEKVEWHGDTKRWVSVTKLPRRDEEGSIIGTMGISRDITERKLAEEALKESREYARNIIESSLDMIITVDNSRRIVVFNRAAQKTFGYSLKEVLGKHVSFLYADAEEGRQVHQKTVKHGRHVQAISNRRKTGETFPALLSASVLCDSGGKTVGVMGVSRDITESQKAEEQIKASLREKEILLREINHRVKNNLQIISSLLSLQSEKIENEETLKMFQESQSRVRTMALIHERLYQSMDFAHVDFREYVSSLVNELYQLYEIDPSRVAVKLEIEDVSLSVSTAVPCGLIINELVTNSLKHAFTPSDKASGDGGEVESEGEVGITLRQTDENVIELIVSDNGTGIPGDIDFRNHESLGLHLVSMLAENQLRGKIELDRSEGTKFRIVFREEQQWQIPKS